MVSLKRGDDMFQKIIKDERINIKVTKLEKSEIQKLAEKRKMNVSEYLLSLVDEDHKKNTKEN